VSGLPTDPAVRRIWRKGKTAVDAWRRVIGAVPSKHAVIRAMSVAEFETRMGDAGHSSGDRSWLGEFNWGAVQKRALTPEESANLRAHGVSPGGGEDAVFAARRLLHAGKDEALHRDSSPRTGWYFVWFWAFKSELEAASKFLEVLVKNRPNVAAIIDTASAGELAAAMYASHYYEGRHEDPAQNIADYAQAIASTGGRIEAALADWTPATAPRIPSDDPSPATARRWGAGVVVGLGLLGAVAIAAWRRA
jgi:hypothetical protein